MSCGYSISIQRKLKRDLFRIAQNLVYVWGMVSSEKKLGLYTLWLLSLTRILINSSSEAIVCTNPKDVILPVTIPHTYTMQVSCNSEEVTFQLLSNWYGMITLLNESNFGCWCLGGGTEAIPHEANSSLLALLALVVHCTKNGKWSTVIVAKKVLRLRL